MGSRTGVLLTLEGGEGSGKTTQRRRIVAHLRGLGRRVVEAREPGATDAGEAIRDVLLHRVPSICPRTELLLYLAARAQLTEEIIRPSIADGIDVVCDRYVDSSTAYQGGGRGLGIADVESMNRWATEDLAPDLTLFFDVEPRTGLERRGRREEDRELDRIERESLDFHSRVRETYLEIARREPGRVRVIRASESEESVWNEVRRALDEKIAAAEEEAS